LSAEWIASVGKARSFARVRWDTPLKVPVTTLDALIAAHGVPRFCKIDVEGAEPDVIAGLSRPLPALSFEYLPAARERALAVVEALEALAAHRYNAVRGETLRFVHGQDVDAARIRRWLIGLPPGAGSGDVYARLA